VSWVTPPTFTTGEDLTAALMNDLSGDLTLLQYAATCSEINGALPSGAPSLKTGNEAGTGSYSTGGVTITFLVPFPTTCAVMVATSTLAGEVPNIVSRSATSCVVKVSSVQSGVMAELPNGSNFGFLWIALGN
jgi:hypothetical protein